MTASCTVSIVADEGGDVGLPNPRFDGCRLPMLEAVPLTERTKAARGGAAAPANGEPVGAGS